MFFGDIYTSIIVIDRVDIHVHIMLVITLILVFGASCGSCLKLQLVYELLRGTTILHVYIYSLCDLYTTYQVAYELITYYYWYTGKCLFQMR